MDSFEEVLPKLKKISLFEAFSEDTEENKRILKAVYDNLTVQTFKKGEVIIKEGDYGDLFYILYKGSVQVLRNTPAGDSMALANLNADQNIFFGETALISGDTRTATVKAVTDCTAVVLSSKKFLALCDKEPVLGYKVSLCLARRMAETLRTTNSDKAVLYAALFSEIEEGGY